MTDKVVFTVRPAQAIASAGSASIKAKTHLWPQWATIAIEHTRAARRARDDFLAIGNEALLAPVVDDPELWAAYLAWEVACCREPGARDGGTHLIAVAKKPVGRAPAQR